tara:strand:- start:465 stop:1010 length:546 start_codon:yes stop_codon:yes gene_type:complete
MHKLFPKKYYYINKFNINDLNKIGRDVCVIYRNYSEKINIEQLVKIKAFCRKKRVKFLLSNNFKLAIKLDLDGAYIPSFNQSFRHLGYGIKKHFLIVGSAHNIKEIRNKESQKVKGIFVSSVFKKNKNYLGINNFNKFKYFTKKKVVALGGINKKNLKLLNSSGNVFFAGISYFEDKKKGP